MHRTLICIALGLLLFFGCTYPMSKQKNLDRITLRVGIILPLSMTGAENFKLSIDRGFHNVLEEYPLLKDSLDIVYSWEDDKNMPEEGLFVFQKLLTQKPVQYIVSFSTPTVAKSLSDMGRIRRYPIIFPLAGYSQKLAATGQIFLGERLEKSAQRMAEKLKDSEVPFALVYTSQGQGAEVYTRTLAKALEPLRIPIREHRFGETSLSQVLSGLSLDTSKPLFFYSGIMEVGAVENELKTLGLADRLITPQLPFTGPFNPIELAAKMEQGAYRAGQFLAQSGMAKLGK